MSNAAFVVNFVPDYRRGLFELLAERERAEYLLFGGRSLHPQDLDHQIELLDAPARALRQREVYGAVMESRPRVVVASTNGRIALPGAYLAARRLGVPFVLWATIWRHPRMAAHALSWLPLRWIYSRADAVVTYGPHVTRYVSRFRRAGNVFEAPQALDNERFAEPPAESELDAVRERTGGRPYLLFVGRLERGKGVHVLAEAWRRLRGEHEDVLLVIAGAGPLAGKLRELPGVLMLGRLPHAELRAWYAGARSLVLPSIPTRAFLEPWGYVVNEAFLLKTPVIASDAVGAAAGGLVRHEANGLVVPAGDEEALAAAMGRAVAEPQLFGTWGVSGRQDVGSYNHTEQARGFELALRACGKSLR